MPSGPVDAGAIRAFVRRSFDEFVRLRLARFPSVRERMAHSPPGAYWILLPSTWWPRLGRAVAGRRYLVLGSRFPDLIAALPATEVVVVGGWREWRLARRLGCAFQSHADLFCASHAILFGRPGGGPDRVIGRWLARLGRMKTGAMIVMHQDTSPISLLLAAVGNASEGTETVCIQHGLFSPEYQGTDIEGRNCRLNLVYDEHQRAEMLRRLPGACVGVMGLPSDAIRCSPPDRDAPSVLFVGVGNPERPRVLLESLRIYRSVRNALPTGLAVVYRPHPSEAAHQDAFPAGMPLELAATPELLAGPRRVFVGFNSTLLYQAKLAGHAVVLLDAPDIPAYELGHIGRTVPASLPDAVADSIVAAWAEDGSSERPAPLRLRFERGLAQARTTSPG